MGCLINHCHDGIASDFAVIAFYASAVGLMITFALLSRSRTIQSTALMIAAVWLVSLMWFLVADMRYYYALTLPMDGALAFQFWRMGQREIFPAILCYVLIGELIFLAAAMAVGLSDFWTIFVLNRVFEAMLLYIITASIFRIRKLKSPDVEAPGAADASLKFIAG